MPRLKRPLGFGAWASKLLGVTSDDSSPAQNQNIALQPVAHAVHLEKVHELLRLSQWPELRRELQNSTELLAPDQCTEAAVLALQAGLPHLAVQLAGRVLEERVLAQADGANEAATQIQLAAYLRLGELEQVQAALAGATHYRDVMMLARAHALAGELVRAQEDAAEARLGAFEAGDASALFAAIALLGELELRTALINGSRSGAMSSLNVLAEGLKIAEQTRVPTDPHVLALVALAQRHVGGFEAPTNKSQATATKALGRSLAFSPASVRALLTLSRDADAHAEAKEGALAVGWWAWAKGTDA